MGTNYTLVLAVGLSGFEEGSEVVDLLNEYSLLTQQENYTLEEEGDYYIQEICSGHAWLPDVECLDYFTGIGYYVGFSLNVREPDKFADSVKESFDKWNKMFPNHPASIVHTVRVS